MVSSGISDKVITSVYSEKNRLKKLMFIIMNKSQEMTVFSGGQKLTSATKVMVDLKFDSIQVNLHIWPPEVRLVEKLSGSLFW